MFAKVATDLRLGGLAASTAILAATVAAADTATFSNTTPMLQASPLDNQPFSPYSTGIVVTGISGTVSNITVNLNDLDSEQPVDITARLESPSGAALNLMATVGGFTAVTGVNLAFNDSGDTIEPLIASLVSGTYSPSTNAGVFEDMPPPAPDATATTLAELIQSDVNGTWTLYLYDQFGGDVHALNGGWELVLEFIAAVLGPTPADEIAHLAASSSASGRIVILNARELSRMRGQDSLATRDALNSFALVADPESGSYSVSQSTMAHASMMGNLYTWIDITGFRAEDDGADRSYTGRGLHIGADVALSPDMVVGLSFGVQDLDSSIGAFSQDGVLRYVQPYLAYRSGAWSGEASLIYGHGDYDQTSDGGDGEGETRLAAVTFSGGYDMAMEDGFVLTPTLAFAHGREKAEGMSGTLADAGSETVRFTQASLGVEASRNIAGGEVFAGIYADWLDTTSDTQLVSDLLVDDGWTGRLALGVSTAMGNGLEFDTSVELSGIGGDLQQTSGAVRFAFRF